MDQPAAMVAAGHPRSAEVGAEVLREGGNAVDAAIAAVLASWVCEPLLTGPGAGGYMLVAGAGEEPALLDFFVAAPGAGADQPSTRRSCPTRSTSATPTQVFNCGVASCGVPGSPAGLSRRRARAGDGAARRARGPGGARWRATGVPLNATQAYVFDLLGGILVATPEARAEFAPDGRPLRAGEPFRSPLLAETIERLGAEGAAPFYAAATSRPRSPRTSARARRPASPRRTSRATSRSRASRRAPATAGARVLTNPPPVGRRRAAGARVRSPRARAAAGAPDAAALVAVMGEVQALRTPSSSPGSTSRASSSASSARSLGSTTHVSVLDGDGPRLLGDLHERLRAPAIVVPGTGIHLNNIMGEQDLNPLGFFRTRRGAGCRR